MNKKREHQENLTYGPLENNISNEALPSPKNTKVNIN